jgi:hypothetical protein
MRIAFEVGNMVMTGRKALIPDSVGQITGLATDDYPGTTEHFVVDFGDAGTCTVHKEDMVHYYLPYKPIQARG